MTVWLLLLPTGLVVMGLAAYTLLRDTSQPRSVEQLHASAVNGCRLGVLSSVLIALCGLGCLSGQASVLGCTMIVLGLAGATGGWLFYKRHLSQVGR